MVKGVPVKEFRSKSNDDLLGELKRLRVTYYLILGRITTNQIH